MTVSKLDYVFLHVWFTEYYYYYLFIIIIDLRAPKPRFWVWLLLRLHNKGHCRLPHSVVLLHPLLGCKAVARPKGWGLLNGGNWNWKSAKLKPLIGANNQGIAFLKLLAAMVGLGPRQWPMLLVDDLAERHRWQSRPAWLSLRLTWVSIFFEDRDSSTI